MMSTLAVEVERDLVRVAAEKRIVSFKNGPNMSMRNFFRNRNIRQYFNTEPLPDSVRAGLKEICMGPGGVDLSRCFEILSKASGECYNPVLGQVLTDMTGFVRCKDARDVKSPLIRCLIANIEARNLTLKQKFYPVKILLRRLQDFGEISICSAEELLKMVDGLKRQGLRPEDQGKPLIPLSNKYSLGVLYAYLASLLMSSGEAVDQLCFLQLPKILHELPEMDAEFTWSNLCLHIKMGPKREVLPRAMKLLGVLREAQELQVISLIFLCRLLAQLIIYSQELDGHDFLRLVGPIMELHSRIPDNVLTVLPQQDMLFKLARVFGLTEGIPLAEDFPRLLRAAPVRWARGMIFLALVRALDNGTRVLSQEEIHDVHTIFSQGGIPQELHWQIKNSLARYVQSVTVQGSMRSGLWQQNIGRWRQG